MIIIYDNHLTLCTCCLDLLGQPACNCQQHSCCCRGLDGCGCRCRGRCGCATECRAGRCRVGATGVTKLCAARRAAAPAALRVSADDMARTWETRQTALKNELRHGNLRKPSQFSHYLRHLVSQERSQERHLTGSLDMTLNAPPLQDSRLRPKRWPVQPRFSFHVM